MQLSSVQIHLPESVRGFSRTLSRAFPTPRLLAPPSAGIDISDASVKWLALESAKKGNGLRVRSWGEIAIPEGVVVGGFVHDKEGLVSILAAVKKELRGIECAHAALPEEAAYVFSMQVPPGSRRAQILSLIEFELEARVPIPPSAAVYDFNLIEKNGAGEEIGVVVFPRDISESYAAAFAAADLPLASLELEASSIARAISSREGADPITLLVDFGRTRSGFAVLKRGIPIFTSTVSIGGGTVIKAIMEKLSLSEAEAMKFNNEQGIAPEGGAKSPGAEAVAGAAAALADEVARHYHYWDTRRNEHGERMTPVEQVYLLGGTSNMKGITDYIAGRVQAPTDQPNVWKNVADFDDYVPPITYRESLQYATAVGLALRGVSLI
ncbi:MAG: pilus assembly protein PilM [Candidatus Kaiserbacteria bacterium]|nr:MAG: pilus assembly protein PilM [Candidatus Kaiserbacteria bacterium]